MIQKNDVESKPQVDCRCVERIRDDLLATYVFKKGARTLRVGFPSGYILIVDKNMELAARTSSIFEAEVEGYLKKYAASVVHQYCPFCGTEYESSAVKHAALNGKRTTQQIRE